MNHRDFAVTEGGATKACDTPGGAARDTERFRHLFEKLPNPAAEIQVIDGEPIIAAVNHRFTERFDADEGVIGRPVTEYTCPDAKGDTAEQIVAAIASNTHRETILSRDTTGATAPLRREIIPYETDGGNHGFLIYSDTTERTAQQADVASRNQQLEKLASTLSHDLRNPVNAAQGWLEQIETTDDDPIDRIERALDRIEAMVDKTLTLTQNPEIIETTEPVDIPELARHCWQRVETEHAELIVDDRFTLLCDSDQMARLLENLFENAVAHNSESVTVRIGIHDRLATATRVSTTPSEAFYITDDGRGIPRTDYETVLEYGMTTSEDGTGLGLPIVKQIAEAHGWEIEVTKTLNGGAKFIFHNATLHGRLPKDGAES